jgi:hypothetical protein
VIIEQINFIDVEEPTIDLSQQARFKAALPLSDRMFKVERANYSILRCGDGELYETRRTCGGREWLTSTTSLTTGAEPSGAIRLARVWTTFNHGDRRKEPR